MAYEVARKPGVSQQLARGRVGHEQRGGMGDIEVVELEHSAGLERAPVLADGVLAGLAENVPGGPGAPVPRFIGCSVRRR